MAIKELRRTTKKIVPAIKSKQKIDVEKKAQEFISKGGTVAQDNSQIRVVGRPKSTERTVKSTVTFLNSQIVWLDRLSANIRANSMAIIDRGSLIRAIISAIEQSNIDLSQAITEEDITKIILENVK